MVTVKNTFSIFTLSIFLLAVISCSTTETMTDATVGVTNSTTEVTSSTTPDGSSDEATNRVKKLRKFAKYNLMNLRQDVAQGRGEYLTSLQTLLEIPPKNRASFTSFAQANYESFFGSENGTSDQTLVQLASFGSDDIRHALIAQMIAKK